MSMNNSRLNEDSSPFLNFLQLTGSSCMSVRVYAFTFLYLNLHLCVCVNVGISIIPIIFLLFLCVKFNRPLLSATK